MSVPFSFMMPTPSPALMEPPGIPAPGSPGVSSWAHRGPLSLSFGSLLLWPPPSVQPKTVSCPWG